MRKFFLMFPILFLTVFGITALAQDSTNQEAMMKAWQEYMTPGPMHKILADGVGTWSGDIKMWEDPSKPPTESKGTSEIKSILGGRYFEQTSTGTFNGMEMNGKEITGYDNAKKIFFSTWIDNFGTGIMYVEGTYDEGTKTFTYNGTTVDPLSGKDIPVMETLKILDNDHHHMEMYMMDNGQQYKIMEIDYTRTN